MKFHTSSHRVVRPYSGDGGVSVTVDDQGHARLDLIFTEPGGKTVFFGTE